MSEKEQKNKKHLDELKQILDCLYDLDMIDYVAEDELFSHLYDELDEKYLVDIDIENTFPDNDKLVQDIKNHLIKWFGKDLMLGFKDGEFYLLIFDLQEDNMKYWYVSKMKVDNIETAKKVAKLFELLTNLWI